jgi:hypothetical protein
VLTDKLTMGEETIYMCVKPSLYLPQARRLTSLGSDVDVTIPKSAPTLRACAFNDHLPILETGRTPTPPISQRCACLDLGCCFASTMASMYRRE